MKYKGFEIEPIYHVGSTFTVKDSGEVVDRKPTSKDIAYYMIYDQGKPWIPENTMAECKATINNFLTKYGWKTNPIE
jgi:hypothetical protein